MPNFKAIILFALRDIYDIRVDAAKAALRKAEDVGLDVSGSALASEAFFPFRDSIDRLAIL